MSRPRIHGPRLSTAVMVDDELIVQTRDYCAANVVGFNLVIESALRELLLQWPDPWRTVPRAEHLSRMAFRIDEQLHAQLTYRRTQSVVGFSVVVERALRDFLAHRRGPAGAPYNWA